MKKKALLLYVGFHQIRGSQLELAGKELQQNDAEGVGFRLHIVAACDKEATGTNSTCF